MAVELELGELFPDLDIEVVKSELLEKRPKRLKSQRSISPLEVIGASQFRVYDEHCVAVVNSSCARQSHLNITTQSTLQTTSILTSPASSFSSLATTFNHQRLPMLTTTTSVCERVPPLLPNGPLNHIERKFFFYLLFVKFRKKELI